jgi:indolepyruvate ferredoxin oxidoreductase alpha subunit
VLEAARIARRLRHLRPRLHARREAFPDAPVLKLGFSCPWPPEKIRAFAAMCDTLVVVEEVEPLVELELKAAGIQCLGKEILPRQGELAPNVLKPAIARLLGEPVPDMPFAASQVFPRPPTMCVACPHIGVYYTLAQIKNITIAGDIGCYTLGAGHPWNALDTTISHGRLDGHGAGHRQGPQRRRQGQADPRRDRRFDLPPHGHAGPARHRLQRRQRHRAAARQPRRGHDRRPAHPASGKDINGDEAPRVDFARLVEALGVKKERIHVLDPYQLPVLFKTVRDEIKIEGLGHHHRPALRADRRLQPSEALRSHRRQVHRLRQLRRGRLPGDPRHAPRQGGQALGQGSRTGSSSASTASACTGCGLCVQPCAPNAIQHAASPHKPVHIVPLRRHVMSDRTT